MMAPTSDYSHILGQKVQKLEGKGNQNNDQIVYQLKAKM